MRFFIESNKEEDKAAIVKSVLNDVAKMMLGSWYGMSEREILFRWDEFIDYIPDRPYNDVRYFISNEKLKDLGWEITYTFERGITELVDSFKV